MRRHTYLRRDERGMALVMALLVLLTLSLLMVVLLNTVSTDTKLAGHGIRESKALNYAEAGVAEACARIRNGDIPNFLSGNPRRIAVIYNCAAGSVPALGVDSIGLATAQPPGQWLTYSSAVRDPNNQLTVTYKTNAARTIIYRYSNLMNPTVNVISGLPIYVIQSTGRDGGDRRTIVAEVIQKPLQVVMHGGLVSQTDIKFTGNAVTCGYSHRSDTPAGTGSAGRLGAGGCAENLAAVPPQWELGNPAADQAGAWSSGAIDQGGAGQPFGSPAMSQGNGNGAFYAGPWEALGMTQAEFWAWVGTPINGLPGAANQNGIFYLDNNGTHQDATGGWNYNAASGSGFLYVDGDLHLNAGFTWRGLIYVEGDLDLNGAAWILGSIIVKGKGQTKFNGGSTVLYSYDAIQEYITKFGGKFTNLSWREL